MWKAAFSGRSEGRSDGRSESGRTSGVRRKKSSRSSDVGVSSVSRRDRDEEGRHGHRSSRSAYGDEDGRGSVYATAPTSRAGTGQLTESAVRALDRDDDWEDEEKDARSEKRSRRGKDGERRQKSSRSEKARSRSRSRERKERRKEGATYKESDGSDRKRQKSRAADIVDAPGSSRAVPTVSAPQEHMMSGGLPTADAAHQFPNQNPATYSRPQAGPARADSYGAAAEYYLDEGQSVGYQPGVRSRTPNMLVNPDSHLMAASVEAHPAEDTGHGSAADFYSGKISPVNTGPAKPTEITTAPSKPSKPARQFSKLSKMASSAAAATAGVIGSTSLTHNLSHNQITNDPMFQQGTTRPLPSTYKPTRQNSMPATTSNGTYYASPQQGNSASEGRSGKQSSQTNSNLPAYAAGAAAAGFAAHEMKDRRQSQQQAPATASTSYHAAGGDVRALPAEDVAFAERAAAMDQSQQYHYHEHRGPITRLKDGLLNLISDPDDVRRMEEYTEYIGVCKYCFDPRSTPRDGPRQHHFHRERSRDSFEELRRRKSYERMYRKASGDSLRRSGSTRIDKDSRYYASDREKRWQSSNVGGMLGAAALGAGVAAGANALFNDRKDFDDTYSIKSGHRESSAMRRRSRSSSQERRRRSTHGVITADPRTEYVTVRTKDGRIEQRRVSPSSRSRSRDRNGTNGVLRAAAGVALGAGAASAFPRERRDHLDNQYQGAQVRHNARSRSRSHSPGLGEIFGFTGPKSQRSGRHSPNGQYYNVARHDRRPSQEEGGIFGTFFSPSQNERKQRRNSREHRKKKGGVFSFGSEASSSDDDMAFGDGFSSKISLPLRRKSSARRVRKRSDEHLAATVAGIGATAAALAAAQKGHRISKRSSRPELGARKHVQTHDARRDHVHGSPGSSDEEEWEDELPSDVDDASSTHSGLAFGGESRLSHRQSMESVSSGDGLSAWGWRWGGKDRKKRRPSSPPPTYPTRPSDSFVGPVGAGLAAGAVAGSAMDAGRRPYRDESTMTSSTSIPQRPMRYVDPRPLSDAGSRHASIPGAFEPEEPPVTRPGPGPIQQPKPVAPISPAFVQGPPEMGQRPMPRRTASSPTRSSFGIQDAALIGAGALAAGSIIASQGRKSKESSNVRFGLTEEQQRKEDRQRRREREEAEEERRRADRTRALKEEAERAAKEEDARKREEDVRRRREDENRRSAEAALERQRAAQREAEQQAEMDRQRRDRERREQEEAYHREQRRLAEEARQQEESKRQWERMAAEEAAREKQAREEREAELQAEIVQKQRELEEQERRRKEVEVARRERQQERDRQEAERKSSVPWGPIAAGAAAAATAGAVFAGSEHNRYRERDTEREREHDEYPEGQALHHPVQDEKPSYAARQVLPTEQVSGSPIMDDDLFDKDFFKRKRSDSDYGRQADKVVSDMDLYYQQPAQSQADFFAPEEILSQRSAGKTKVAEPPADNEVAIYRNSMDDDPRSRFDYSAYDGPKGRSRHAPYGVPELNLIAATPPPSAPSSVRGKGSRPSSALAHHEEAEEQAEAGAGPGKRDRSRSISWATEDKVHAYDPPTPDSFQERDSYMTARDAPSAPQTPPGDRARDATSGSERSARRQPSYDTRDEHEVADSPIIDIDEVADLPSETPPLYQKPFFESVSDVGLGCFGMDSPGTEGAPPVRGYIEGDTDEPTPADEKTPHVPGGFDDDVYDDSKLKRDLADATPVAEPAEPSWEPPLSKKEKKKREKAAKRAYTVDSEFSEPSTPVAEEVALPPSEPAETPKEEEPADYFMSKKDKKKRDKALKRGLSDTASPPAPETKRAEIVEDSPSTEVTASEPDAPKLSKKEQKKRDKESKRQGFADVADTVMTAGGVTALAAAAAEAIKPDASDAAAEDEWALPSSSKKPKKGKKKSKEPERDIRDVEPSSETAESKDEPSHMPGGWESETVEKAGETPMEAFDPFQYQVKDEATPTQEAEPSWSDFTSTKSKKKKKRESGRFNEPAAASPLRSEWNYNDYIGDQAGNKDVPAPAAEPSMTNEPETYTNGDKTYNEPLAKSETGPMTVEAERASDDRAARGPECENDDVRVSDEPRRELPEEGRSRSVASEPAYDREGRRKSSSKARSEVGYADDPDYYDDRSVAGSEPVGYYDNAKRSKRRSKLEDDDTASVVSSRFRREKEESPVSKKDKKGGLFGLFSRKSSDTVPFSRQSTRSDEAPLSRTSTRESKGCDEDDGERKHRRRKHREGSVYGDDDDDTRSVASESRHRRRGDRDERDEDSRERRRSSRYGDDDFDTRSEPGHKHRHHSLHEDDDDTASRAETEGGRRHHHRCRTDEDAYDSKDQSFLGNRVEDLPPLPASPPESPVLAPAKTEQDVGSPVSAEPDTRTVGVAPPKVSDDDSLLHKEEGRELPEPSLDANASSPSVQPDTEDLPALPLSRPESPIETPQRPATLARPTSTTAVPLRFPFGHIPMQQKERSASFGPQVPLSPASSSSTQKKPRPTSTEMMPLYLVERNRKTQDLAESLPSLPSSKPSSRASSIQGSDDWHSAVEDPPSPDRVRALNLDIDQANAYVPAEDYLDSQQTTPKASEFRQTAFHRPTRQEPQYYTWEDFEQDERLHSTGDEEQRADASAEVEAHDAIDESAEHQQSSLEPEQYPALPHSRPGSPYEVESGPEHKRGHSTKGLAAAAMLGTAAVLAHGVQQSKKAEEDDDHSVVRQETVPAHDSVSGRYPLPAPVDEAETPSYEPENPEEQPALARRGSRKKGKGKKAKVQQAPEPAHDTSATEPAALAPLEQVSTEQFESEERWLEDGAGAESLAESSLARDNERFVEGREAQQSDEARDQNLTFVGNDVPLQPSTADPPEQVVAQKHSPNEMPSADDREFITPSETEEVPDQFVGISESAASAVSEQMVNDDDSGSVPTLTRKQSKKAKKKQKAAALALQEDTPVASGEDNLNTPPRTRSEEGSSQTVADTPAANEITPGLNEELVSGGETLEANLIQAQERDAPDTIDDKSFEESAASVSSQRPSGQIQEPRNEQASSQYSDEDERRQLEANDNLHVLPATEALSPEHIPLPEDGDIDFEQSQLEKARVPADRSPQDESVAPDVASHASAQASPHAPPAVESQIPTTPSRNFVEEANMTDDALETTQTQSDLAEAQLDQRAPFEESSASAAYEDVPFVDESASSDWLITSKKSKKGKKGKKPAFSAPSEETPTESPAAESPVPDAEIAATPSMLELEQPADERQQQEADVFWTPPSSKKQNKKAKKAAAAAAAVAVTAALASEAQEAPDVSTDYGSLEEPTPGAAGNEDSFWSPLPTKKKGKKGKKDAQTPPAEEEFPEEPDLKSTTAAESTIDTADEDIADRTDTTTSQTGPRGHESSSFEPSSTTDAGAGGDVAEDIWEDTAVKRGKKSKKGKKSKQVAFLEPAADHETPDEPVAAIHDANTDGQQTEASYSFRPAETPEGDMTDVPAHSSLDHAGIGLPTRVSNLEPESPAPGFIEDFDRAEREEAVPTERQPQLSNNAEDAPASGPRQISIPSHEDQLHQDPESAAPSLFVSRDTVQSAEPPVIINSEFQPNDPAAATIEVRSPYEDHLQHEDEEVNNESSNPVPAEEIGDDDIDEPSADIAGAKEADSAPPDGRDEDIVPSALHTEAPLPADDEVVDSGPEIDNGSSGPPRETITDPANSFADPEQDLAISTAPQVSFQAENEVTSANADSEEMWTDTARSKSKKKGKKGKRTAEEVGLEPELPRKVAELGNSQVELLGPESGNTTSDQAESAWTGFSVGKKKKKGKKGKKAAAAVEPEEQTLADDQTAELAPEGTSNPDLEQSGIMPDVSNDSADYENAVAPVSADPHRVADSYLYQDTTEPSYVEQQDGDRLPPLPESPTHEADEWPAPSHSAAHDFEPELHSSGQGRDVAMEREQEDADTTQPQTRTVPSLAEGAGLSATPDWNIGIDGEILPPLPQFPGLGASEGSAPPDTATSTAPGEQYSTPAANDHSLAGHTAPLPVTDQSLEDPGEPLNAENKQYSADPADQQDDQPEAEQTRELAEGPTEPELTWTAPTSKKGKKKGKKARAVEEAAVRDEPKDETIDDFGGVQRDAGGRSAAVGGLAAVAAIAGDVAASQDHETSATDEWPSAPAKTKKGKRKAKKGVTFSLANEVPEFVRDQTDARGVPDVGMTVDRDSSESMSTEPDRDIATEDAEVKVSEARSLENGAVAEPTVPTEDIDWPPATSKRSKKEKRRAKQNEPASPAEPASQEATDAPERLDEPDPSMHAVADFVEPGQDPSYESGDAFDAKQNFAKHDPDHQPILAEDENVPEQTSSGNDYLRDQRDIAEERQGATQLATAEYDDAAALESGMTTAEAEASASIEAEWPVSSTKKSKKDKKKAKKAALALPDTEDDKDLADSTAGGELVTPASAASTQQPAILTDEEPADGNVVYPTREAGKATGKEEAWPVQPLKMTKKVKRKARKNGVSSVSYLEDETLSSTTVDTPSTELTATSVPEDAERSAAVDDERAQQTEAQINASQDGIMADSWDYQGTRAEGVTESAVSPNPFAKVERGFDDDAAGPALAPAMEQTKYTDPSADSISREPAEVETVSEVASAARATASPIGESYVPQGDAPADPSNADSDSLWPGVVAKRSKKDKRKAKKGASVALVTLDEPQSSGDTPIAGLGDSQPLEALATVPDVETAPSIDTLADTRSVDDLASTDPPPNEEGEWPTFSTKRTKKEKRKAKKAAYAATDDTPETMDAVLESTQVDPDVAMAEALPSTREDIKSIDTDHETEAGDMDAEKPSVEQPPLKLGEVAAPRDVFDASRVAEELAAGGDEPSRHAEDGASVPLPDDDSHDLWRDGSSNKPEIPVTTPEKRPAQDIYFAATLAAGLADSGFDPTLVVNDPTFHRRASPSGTMAEADPEEVFTMTTKRGKKGKKGKKSQPSEGAEDVQPALEATKDLNDELSSTLQSSGFDPALLHQITSSNETTAPSSSLEDEPGFSFSTSKRKKKDKKARFPDIEDSTADATPISETPDETVQPSDVLLQPADGDNGAPSAEDFPVKDQEVRLTPDEASAINTDPVSLPVVDDTTDVDAQMSQPETSSLALDPAHTFNVAGDRDMDIDEMDKAYSAFKKKDKKKRKKQKAGSVDATQAQEQVAKSDRTPAQAEDLSRSTDFEDLSAPPGPGGEDKSWPTDRPDDLPPTSPVSPTSRVQRIFPGLERVKRRQPFVTSPTTSAPLYQQQDAGESRRDGLLHTSEVSQSLPVPAQPSSSEGPSLGAGHYHQQDVGQRGSPHDRDFATGALLGAAGLAGAAAYALGDRPEAENEREPPPASGGSPRNTVRSAQANWSFDALKDHDQPIEESPTLGTKEHQIARDSGYQEPNTPLLSRRALEDDESTLPEIRTAQSRESLRSRRSAEPLHIHTDASSDWNLSVPKKRMQDSIQQDDARPRTPSGDADKTPLESTTKNRASYLFQSPPANLRHVESIGERDTPKQGQQASDYFTRPSIDDAMRSVSSPPPSGPLSPRIPLESIPEEHGISKRSKEDSDVGGPAAVKALRRTETPQAIRASRELALSPETRPSVSIPTAGIRSTSNPLSTDDLIKRLSWPAVDDENGTVNINRSLKRKSSKPALPDPRSGSVLSDRSNASAGNRLRSPSDARSFSRTSNRSSTSTLRRIDRSLSGDLRAASRRGDSGSAVGARSSPKTIPFEPPPTPPSNDEDVIDTSAARAAAMADVFGYGDAQGSQSSPTRPPSVRKRQSMHINDLESRLDELVAENRALQEAKHDADRSQEATSYQRDVDNQDLREALESRELEVREKDTEIHQIRAMLDTMQEELDRLNEINGGLSEANRNLVDDTNGRYATLQAEHAHAHEQWQSTNRELENARQEHGRFTSGVQQMVEAQVATALADRNAEILRLREELDIASERIRALQVQIQSSKANDFLRVRDEDYFDGTCQKLCQHVQQWVLRFSKLSDNRICRLSIELNDDKIEARLDNAILDGSDVDKLLGDRVRRRDVFMSVVMTMVWEYVFTRYLFGMDREQRQKLKALEKILAEVGPPRAVSQWRATTLTLLSKRPDFASQCSMDTEAVSNEIFALLCRLLPPPSNAEDGLSKSLQKVVGIAVDLSIEMRTQRAEYIMLPPLQPEYDKNGDLVRKVHFNASLMNERSGLFSSNEELEQERSVVKIVLFPLVVKKGDETGEGEEEIVVCPAQVLVQNDNARSKKVVRVMSGAMEIDDPRRSRQSLVSTAPGSTAF